MPPGFNLSTLSRLGHLGLQVAHGNGGDLALRLKKATKASLTAQQMRAARYEHWDIPKSLTTLNSLGLGAPMRCDGAAFAGAASVAGALRLHK